MSVRTSDSILVLLTSLGLCLSACASLPADRPSDVPVQFESYDLPQSHSPNAVIGAVEEAFRAVLGAPVRLTEGGVPALVPNEPAGFLVETREVVLEGLGQVWIPRVVCPDGMAILHAFDQEQAGDQFVPSRVTACIQAHTGGYRIHVIRSPLVPGAGPSLAEPSLVPLGEDANPLSRIRLALFDQVGDLEPVGEDKGTEIASSQDMVSGQERLEAKRPGSAKGAFGPGTSAAGDRAPLSVTPLVCLTPVRDKALVRSVPGGGRVLSEILPGTVLAVEEPLESGYVRVAPVGKPVGWVSRTEVKRLPCPVA
ncbi:MAG: hypothetical protein ACREI3_06395 [Nitrospirales bacterium]